MTPIMLRMLIIPFKHGYYVPRVADWPYSTFHRYVDRGIYPLDWGGDIGATQ